MEQPPQKSWKIDGCRGRFYVRGKKNIIWYEAADHPRSLKLPFNRRNRKIAGELVQQEELRSIRRPQDPALFTDAYKLYFENVLSKRSDGTKQCYANAIGNIIEECLIFETDKIQEIIENKIYNLLNKKEVSKITINNHLTYLHAVFNYFVKKKWIEENPVNQDFFFKVPNKPIEIFSDNEMAKLFNYWAKKDFQFYLFLNLLYKTAFRISEALELRWWQVWQNDAWHNEIILKKSKYGNISEGFPLAPVIVEILDKTKTDREPDNYIFRLADSVGKIHYRTNIARRFTDSFKRLNIPLSNYMLPGRKRSIHTLRKTRITEWIVKDKLDVITVKKLSRDNIQTVLKYYAALQSQDYQQYIK